MNALTHGIFASRNDAVTAKVLGEDPTEINALIEDVANCVAPQTVVERAVARSIADRIIADNRVSRLEAAVLSSCDLTVAERDEVGGARDEVAFATSVLAAIDDLERHDGEHVDDDEPEWIQLVHDLLARNVHHPPFRLCHTTLDGEERGLETADDWREKFEELLCLLFGDLAAARLSFEAHVDWHRPAAELEARQIAGIEARRLLVELDRISVLRERVSRGLASALAAYRILGEPD